MMIVIEGGDAAGKATQSARLAEALHGRRFAFPDYTTPIGKVIEAHLHKKWEAREHRKLKNHGTTWDEHKKLDALVFQSCMTANRMEKVMEMQECLLAGTPIVCDRYWQSGYVYGTLDGLDPDHMEGLHKYLPQADVNILIDSDVKLSFERRPERRDRYESDRAFLEKVVQSYRDLWMRKIDAGDFSYVIVDGRQSVDKVEADIHAALDELR